MSDAGKIIGGYNKSPGLGSFGTAPEAVMITDKGEHISLGSGKQIGLENWFMATGRPKLLMRLALK